VANIITTTVPSALTPDRCPDFHLPVLNGPYVALSPRPTLPGTATIRTPNDLAAVLQHMADRESRVVLTRHMAFRGLTGGASAASEEPKAMSESAARAC
jgi:hypothetical protein